MSFLFLFLIILSFEVAQNEVRTKYTSYWLLLMIFSFENKPINTIITARI